MRKANVQGYPNYYVTDNGEVWSRDYNHTGVEQRLKQSLSKKGYKYVALWLNGKQLTKSVHRLIGIAFIPNPLNLPQINHIDCDKGNNNVINLEWCTNKYNHIHAYQNGREAARGESSGMSRLKVNDVIEIKRLYATGNYSYKSVAKLFGVTRGAVDSILNNKTWKHIP